MNEKEPARVVLAIRIRPEALERLKALAEQNQMNMSTMARLVFATGMQNLERNSCDGPQEP